MNDFFSGIKFVHNAEEYEKIVLDTLIEEFITECQDGVFEFMFEYEREAIHIRLEYIDDDCGHMDIEADGHMCLGFNLPKSVEAIFEEIKYYVTF